jgi:hypothetical protein
MVRGLMMEVYLGIVFKGNVFEKLLERVWVLEGDSPEPELVYLISVFYTSRMRPRIGSKKGLLFTKKVITGVQYKHLIKQSPLILPLPKYGIIADWH